MSTISKQISDDGTASHPVLDRPEPTAVSNGATRHDGQTKVIDDPANGATASMARKSLKLSTVSHTLDAEIAERLRHFAFRERISESAVIESSLRTFFSGGDDAVLGKHLRDGGAGLRRKS